MKFAANAGLVAGLFFSLPALATTFGAIGVVEQAEEAQFYLRGHITSSAQVRLEPRVRVPYTYWKFVISEQFIGESLGAEIILREPGGEIGELGYHLAGTASFNDGEDVFVTVRSTDEDPSIKEIIGLASGKYRVQTEADGSKSLINGLGLPLLNASGQPIRPAEFGALLHRVRLKQSTKSDRNIFVNNGSVPDDHESTALNSIKSSLPALPAAVTTTTTQSDAIPTMQAAPVQPSQGLESAEKADERKPSSEEEQPASYSWVGALVVIFGVLASLVLLVRKAR